MGTCGNSSMTEVPGPHRKSFNSSLPRRTTVSHSESPQDAFVSGSRLSASSPFWLSRFILSFIGVAIGVSAGAATGFTLALVNAPNETVAASSDAIQANAALLAAHIGQPATDSVTNAVDVHFSSAKTLAKVHAPASVQTALNRMPDAVKPAMFKLGGKEWRVARPIVIPVS